MSVKSNTMKKVVKIDPRDPTKTVKSNTVKKKENNWTYSACPPWTFGTIHKRIIKGIIEWHCGSLYAYLSTKG